jgi:CheY-like chemotaxis protein
MPSAKPLPPTDQNVYAVTARGEAELTSADTTLAPLPLRLLVLTDGHSPVSAVRGQLSGASDAELNDALRALLRDGMICPASNVESDAIDFDMGGLSAPIAGGGFRTAEKESASGLKSLTEHGYFVRIVRRPKTAPALPVGRKPVVVVVEDEVHLAKFVGHLLAFEGFEVRSAANRDEVVEAVRESPVPDLILLDVMLPDADGFEILDRVRQHPVLQRVPVIMITTRATREDVLRGLALGADGYITKPLQPEVLTKAIRTTLGQTQPIGATDKWHERDT